MVSLTHGEFFLPVGVEDNVKNGAMWVGPNLPVVLAEPRGDGPAHRGEADGLAVVDQRERRLN